jgi:type I restriction enzyme S subunit
VLMAMYGDGKTITTLGILANEAASNQACCAMIADRELCNPMFLFYALKYHRNDFIRIASGGAQRNLSGMLIRRFAINTPPLLEQGSIAQVLGALDDKIKLNRQMNETLEAIARAIFKSWFVDFDPVRAKAEGRQALGMDAETAALFPRSFEDSPLGKIPKNWHALRIGDLFKYVLGGDWGRDELSDTFSVYAAVIRGTDFSNLENCQDEEVPLRFVQPSKYEKRRLRPFDLVLEISGGSRDQPTGRSMLVTKGILERLGGEVIPASFCRLIRSQDEDHAYFLALHLAILYEEGGTWNYQNQSTGISNFQFEYFSDHERLPFPDTEAIIRAFGNQMRPLLSRIDHNQTETRCLRAIRDALLPKLVSGEIRIKDDEKMVEEKV